jgi:hypothetical protein
MFIDSEGLFRQVADVLRQWGKDVDTTKVYRKCEVKAPHILELEREMMAPNIVWITRLVEFIVLKQNESVTTSSNTSVPSVQMFSTVVERTYIQTAVTCGLTRKHLLLMHKQSRDLHGKNINIIFILKFMGGSNGSLNFTLISLQKILKYFV